jgi:hypothetical protein
MESAVDASVITLHVAATDRDRRHGKWNTPLNGSTDLKIPLINVEYYERCVR